MISVPGLWPEPIGRTIINYKLALLQENQAGIGIDSVNQYIFTVKKDVFFNPEYKMLYFISPITYCCKLPLLYSIKPPKSLQSSAFFAIKKQKPAAIIMQQASAFMVCVPL